MTRSDDIERLRAEVVMGVKLLQEFFSWAEAKGATSIIMKAPVGNTAERMAKFYRRLGFEPLETQFVRRCST